MISRYEEKEAQGFWLGQLGFCGRTMGGEDMGVSPGWNGG